jgi:tetratricopeptide (TPR) repeat protein
VHRILPLFGFSLFLGLFSVSHALAFSADSAASALIAEGDRFSEKVFDNQKALQMYIEALPAAENKYPVYWRLSRTYADIGAHMPSKTDTEKQKQLETYQMSLSYANKAIEINPQGSMGYVRRAITSGRIALFKGIWDAIDLVKQTRADCEKAISIDPKEAAAYYVLGRTNAKVCEKPKFVRWPLGLGWANLDDAITNYEKSIELRPDFIMYRLDCARTYIEQDEYAKARAHLTAIQLLSKQNEDDDQFRSEAKELQEKIKDK